jgi:hypothetical protein
VSPTAPTYATLNNQLTKAHSRIRELQARETALAADNRTLRAVLTELTHDDHPRTAELASWSNDRSDGFGIGDDPGEHTHQLLARPHRSPPGNQRRIEQPQRPPTAPKRGGSRMFDLDPIGTIFLLIAVLWLIAAIAYGRDDR